MALSSGICLEMEVWGPGVSPVGGEDRMMCSNVSGFYRALA
jgi:hypothetical protein